MDKGGRGLTKVVKELLLEVFLLHRLAGEERPSALPARTVTGSMASVPGRHNPLTGAPPDAPFGSFGALTAIN